MKYIKVVELSLVLAILCSSTTFAQCEQDSIVGKWLWLFGEVEFKADQTEWLLYSASDANKLVNEKIGTWAQNGETYTLTGISGPAIWTLKLSEDCEQLIGHDQYNPTVDTIMARRLHPPVTATEAKDCATSCKASTASAHLVWNGQGKYPDCVCICEDGWKDDGHGNCVPDTSELEEELTKEALKLELETPQGIKEIRPGEKNDVNLDSNQQAKLIARCKALEIELANAEAANFVFLMGSVNNPNPAPEAHSKLWVEYFVLNCKDLIGKTDVEKTFEDNSGLPQDSSKLMPLKLSLESGPIEVEVSQDFVAIDVETQEALISSTGRNRFAVGEDPSSGLTLIAALQNPILIQPRNSSLAPFTLGAGQRVEVTSEGVGAAVPIGQTGTNGTAPGSGSIGVPGTGNATIGNATNASTTSGISVPSGNNQIGDTADVSGGQSVSQTISPAGSSNFYRIHVDTPGILELKLGDVPKDMRAYMSLYDKNMDSIAEKSASNTGDTLILEKDILGPGWFYIEVRDLDGKAHSEPYSLNMSFKPAPDPYEPNPNYYRAVEVKSGDVINAYICPVNDEDFYKIHVDTAGILKLKLNEVPEGMRSELYVYDENLGGPSVALGSASNSGDKVSIEQGVSGPSWYYIKVRDLNSKAYGEPYTLKVTFEPAPDQYEPNPNYFRATEIALGETITAYICPVNDEDIYKFHMGSPGIVKLKLDSVPEDMRSGLQLYDKTFGNEIAYSSASSSGDKVSLEKDVQGTGWFYIKVRDIDSKAHSQPYTLTVAL